MIELVTGRGGSPHVTSHDIGWFQAWTSGPGRYRLTEALTNGRVDTLKISVVDNNTVTISEGGILADGRFIRVSKGGEVLNIATGVEGAYRVDKIVVRYRYDVMGDDYLESAELVVLQGENAQSQEEAHAPEHVEGSILRGDNWVEIPLYTVPVNGIYIGTPSEIMLDYYELPTLLGGHGEGQVLLEMQERFLSTVEATYNEMLAMHKSSFEAWAEAEAARAATELEREGAEELRDAAEAERQAAYERSEALYRQMFNALADSINATDRANKAADAARESVLKVSENTSKIATLWAAVFGAITTNPFTASFGDLDGFDIISGVYNEMRSRLEC